MPAPNVSLLVENVIVRDRWHAPGAEEAGVVRGRPSCEGPPRPEDLDRLRRIEVRVRGYEARAGHGRSAQQVPIGVRDVDRGDEVASRSLGEESDRLVLGAEPHVREPQGARDPPRVLVVQEPGVLSGGRRNLRGRILESVVERDLARDQVRGQEADHLGAVIEIERVQESIVGAYPRELAPGRVGTLEGLVILDASHLEIFLRGAHDRGRHVDRRTQQPLALRAGSIVPTNEVDDCGIDARGGEGCHTGHAAEGVGSSRHCPRRSRSRLRWPDPTCRAAGSPTRASDATAVTGSSGRLPRPRARRWGPGIAANRVAVSSALMWPCHRGYFAEVRMTIFPRLTAAPETGELVV